MLHDSEPLTQQRQHRRIAQMEHGQPAAQPPDVTFHQGRSQRDAWLRGRVTACLHGIDVLRADQQQRKEARHRHAGEYPERGDAARAACEPGNQQRCDDLASMISSLVASLLRGKFLFADKPQRQRGQRRRDQCRSRRDSDLRRQYQTEPPYRQQHQRADHNHECGRGHR